MTVLTTRWPADHSNSKGCMFQWCFNCWSNCTGRQLRFRLKLHCMIYILRKATATTCWLCRWKELWPRQHVDDQDAQAIDHFKIWVDQWSTRTRKAPRQHADDQDSHQVHHSNTRTIRNRKTHHTNTMNNVQTNIHHNNMQTNAHHSNGWMINICCARFLLSNS